MTKTDGATITAAALTSAFVSYLVLAIAARALRPAPVNSAFVTFWSLLFACFGILTGISVETTRAVKARVLSSIHDEGKPKPLVIVVGATAGLLVAAVIGGTSHLWAQRIFSQTPSILVVAVIVGVLGFSVHTTLDGALVGYGYWRTYSGLVAGIALLRITAVLIVWAISPSVWTFAAATVLPEFSWAIWLILSGRSRKAFLARADLPPSRFVRKAVVAALSGASSATLIVGFPFLLSITTPQAEYASATPLLMAITVTRAPLLLPLNAFQGVLIAHFVQKHDRILRAVNPVLGAITAVGACGAGLSYFFGNFALNLIFGPSYTVPNGVLAGLTVGAAMLATLTVTGTACQALNRHRAFLGGWIVAVVVAGALLLLPHSIEVRAVLALNLGPLAGTVLHFRAGLLSKRDSSHHDSSARQRPPLDLAAGDIE